MKWFIVYIMTSFGEPSEVIITTKSYNTFDQCKQHEFYHQDGNGSDFSTVNAMCVQEKTFDDFYVGDFEGAMVTDARQLKNASVKRNLL